MNQGIRQTGDFDQVSGDRFAFTAGTLIQDPGSGGTGIEMDLIPADAVGLRPGPVIESDRGWGRGQASFNQPRTQPDTEGGFIDILTRLPEEGSSFRVFEKNPVSFQDQECFLEDLIAKGRREEVNARTKTGNHDRTLPRSFWASRTAAGAFSP
jgi:hypothetical protein